MENNLTRLIETLEKKKIIKVIDKERLEVFAEDIALSEWSVEDIYMAGEQENTDITHDQARTILQRLEHNHDATIGINWDVIKAEIDNF